MTDMPEVAMDVKGLCKRLGAKADGFGSGHYEGLLREAAIRKG